MLCTSRQRLSIAGEVVYRMPSLSIGEGVALFAARASAVNPRFALDESNAAVIAEICRRLDGIPLALELAAARIDILTPKALHDRLADRFRLLSRGDRTAGRRHRADLAGTAVKQGASVYTGDTTKTFAHATVIINNLGMMTAEDTKVKNGWQVVKVKKVGVVTRFCPIFRSSPK